MKKQCAVAALAEVSCATAHAQASVTLYGVIDTNIEFLNHAGADVRFKRMGVPGADYILSKRADVYATVAYAASTRYANHQYTPVGLTSDTASVRTRPA
ncbi:MAG TPA: hypothetical protein VHV99_21060 [Paraburkholderia sp.]|nr:hypothetical protein [Paraburkholderia sp.]